MGLRWFLLALLVYCAIAASLTGPALLGQASITPEGFLDGDRLYGHPKSRAKLRPFDDPTSIVLELGRERAVASGLWHGRLDTWNPWSAAGAPLWTEQGGPFFPTKLIYYLYPHHVTLMAALAARLVVAALGMFFLARALGLSPPVALFTGALFEYSGICTAVLTFATFSAMYVLPWGLLGAHRLLNDPGPRAVAITGLALGIAWLGGNPSFALIVYLAFGAWVIGECVRKRPPPRELGRLAALVSAAALVALLVAAVNMLPFLELWSHGHSYKSTPAAELVWRERLGWTRDVFALAMFFPSLLTAMRDTMPLNYWPFAGGASIGLVALLLALAGTRRLLKHWGLVIMAILGVGLTLSPAGFQWLHQLPGLHIIIPWYCYPLMVVPLCIAAGYGLQVIAAAPRKELLLIPLGAVLFAIALLAALEILNPGLYRTTLKLNVIHIQNWKTYGSLAAVFVAVATYLLLSRSNLARAAAVVAAIAVVEAAAVRIPIVNFERGVVLRFGPSEATARLQNLLAEGSWRYIGVPPLQVGIPNTALLFDLRDFRSQSSLAIRRITEFMELAGAPAEDPWKRPEWQYPVAVKLPMLSLAAVKYVVYAKGYLDGVGADVPSGLRELGATGEAVLFENPLALPRFRVSHDVIAAEGEEQASEILRRMLDDSPSGAAPEWARRTVIEGVSRDEALRARSAPGSASASESVRLVAEPDPQTIVLEANLAAPGYVIVADTYYPGWTATVDGAPATIHPANLMFRAVHVPAGKHTLVMKYESTWLRFGGALTLLGLLLAAVLLALPRQRTEQRT